MVLQGRHHVWRGQTDKLMPRPIGDDIDAHENACNAYLKARRVCLKPAIYQQGGYLPVCKKHKARKLRAGRCQHIGHQGRCARLIRHHPPFAELCNDHRDWDGFPCWLLKLPVELRMQIFSYLLPDKPINAWLDSPLRNDRSRCSWELLLVNHQIRDEAMDILYGSQTFVAGLGRENLVVCGGVYAHDKSEWPSIMVYNPPRIVRTGHFPPMLKYIRHMKLQVTFVNPGYPAGRPQHYPVWDESIDLYDLRDSARALVHLLSQSNSLLSLSIVLIAQNIFGKAWTSEELCRILKTVGEPLMQLRKIPKASVEAIFQIHSGHRLSLTQYFPDHMRPATSDDDVAKPGEYVLTYNHSGHNSPTLIRVTPLPMGDPEFDSLRNSFEKAVTSKDMPEEHPDHAMTMKRFDAFRKAYHSVEHNFRTVLPRGKDWLLHKARMAREEYDAEGIAKVRAELEAEVKRLIKRDRDNINAKEQATMAALKEFDAEIGGKKRALDRVDAESLRRDFMDSGGEDEDDEVEERPYRISIARRRGGGIT